MKTDLHIHSNYSDGSLPPEEVVDNAIALGITAMAITDHDNILAYEIAKNHVAQKEEKPVLELIPGIEVNTLWNGHEVHILGYYMNLDAKPLHDLIKYQQHARIEQIFQIIVKLNKEGIPIQMEDITKLISPGGSIGRPHIARAITNIGGARSMTEAYNKYINDNASTYIQRNTVSPHEAVEAIYESVGIPVIAHPCDLDIAEDLIKELMNYGLRGIEAYHRKHSPAIIEYYSCMAENLGLIVTGGSDCHGPRPNGQMFLGKNFVPEWTVEELKKEKNRLEIASL